MVEHLYSRILRSRVGMKPTEGRWNAGSSEPPERFPWQALSPQPWLWVLALCLTLVPTGCARHWCVAVLETDDAETIIRAQSPEDFDPAFDPAFRQAAPATRPQQPSWDEPNSSPVPSTQYSPAQNPYASSPTAQAPAAQPSPLAPTRAPQLEATPAIGNEVLSSPYEPILKASPILSRLQDEPTAPNSGEPLVDVRIEGNATIPVAAMMRYIKSRPNRATTVDQVREDVRALYNTKWFFSIEPVYRREADGIVLVFKVTERPILKSVEYRGNKNIKEHVLAGITGLKPLHAFSVATNREAARRLGEFYRDKGYMFAEITLIEGGDPDDRTVVFGIEEGPRVQVSTVKFQGNSDISSELLKLRLATKKRILWKFGGQYDPANIPEDIASIKEYYHNIGYFDTQVSEKVDFSADRSAVTITYSIVEGPRYKIRDIRLKGNQIFSGEQLTAEFETRSGDFFSARILAKDVGKVQGKYGEQGRLFAKVEPATVFTQEPGVVDLVLNIDEDRVYRIGMINVHIRGDHSHTKQTVALNQMLVAPGELADPEKIRRTKARFAGSAVWEGGGPVAPEINIRPVANPTYLVQNPPADTNIYRGSSNHFGDERPVNLKSINWSAEPADPTESVPHVEHPAETPGTATLRPEQWLPEEPLPETRNRQERRSQPEAKLEEKTGFIPTTFREERPRAQQPQTRQLPAAGVAAVPGTGHTIQTPWRGPTTADVQRLRQTASTAPAAVAPAAPPVANWSAPEAAPALSPQLAAAYQQEQEYDTDDEWGYVSLYEPLDLHDTVVFRESADPYFHEVPELPAQSLSGQPVIRAQNYDNYTRPPNLMYNETPGGDLLGPQMVSPVVPPGYVDLDVHLSEARTGRFMIGAGVNSDSGVVGNIVLEEQNFDILAFPRSFRDVVDGYAFRGAGQQFRMEATPGSEVSRYMVSWTDPFFLNTDYSLGLSGFYYQRFFRDWTEQRAGGRINVGKLLTRELSFNTALRLENVDVSRARLPPGMAPSVDEIMGSNFLGTGRFTLAYDTRDSPFMATEGFNVTSSVEQAFAEYYFTKLELQASNYYTVYQRPDGAGKHIVSLRGNLGWSTDDTPAFERFYAGGFQTFRGFEFRTVSPLEPGNIGTSGAAVGGFFQALGTAEYMVPVMANEAVRLVAFSDFGTVDEDVSLDKFRVSVGAGLRITVPQMGPVPIALDWAFPVVKEDSDVRQIFSFYIGLTR